MNHSGIILTSRDQDGIQNVYVWAYVHERGLPEFWAGSTPCLVAPLPFFSVLLPGLALFPPRKLNLSSPPTLLLSLYIIPTIDIFLVLGDRKHPSSSRPRCLPINNPHRCEEHHGGLQAKPCSPFFPTSPQQVWPYSPFSASTTVLSSPPLLPFAVSLHASLISLTVYLWWWMANQWRWSWPHIHHELSNSIVNYTRLCCCCCCCCCLILPSSLSLSLQTTKSQHRSGFSSYDSMIWTL